MNDLRYRATSQPAVGGYWELSAGVGSDSSWCISRPTADKLQHVQYENSHHLSHVQYLHELQYIAAWQPAVGGSLNLSAGAGLDSCFFPYPAFLTKVIGGYVTALAVREHLSLSLLLAVLTRAAVHSYVAASR